MARKNAEGAPKKTGRSGTARTSSTPKRAAGAPGGGVRVRMYCQGLGDCFLLTFPRARRPFRALIDCGVILGTPDPEGLIRPVVEDILEETGGHLDLLIVTHEHWDHVSGFVQAQDLFEQFKAIDAVWLAWTEDPGDAIAGRLRNERQAKIAALETAARSLAFEVGLDATDDEVRAGLETLSFLGIDVGDALGVRGAAGKARTTADAMKWLQSKAPLFLRPGGDPRGLDGVDGVRVYVLGPPTDPARLRKDRPRHGSGEAYEMRLAEQSVLSAFAETQYDLQLISWGNGAAAPTQGKNLVVVGTDDNGLLHIRIFDSSGNRVKDADEAQLPDKSVAISALKQRLQGLLPPHVLPPTEVPQLIREATSIVGHTHATSEHDRDAARFRPFDPAFRLTLDEAERDPFFAETYFAEDEAWRRLEGEGVAALARFALQLDGDTNNTSLALAFELPDGRVLLFPGDAQIGNWQSWHDYRWTLPGGEVRAADLLRRTVLYKVGHHGSHNATLKDEGLELMAAEPGGPGLVAMVPVDEYIAHEKKGWTKMPFRPLLDRLAAKTEGRILRPDKTAADLPAGLDDFAAAVTFSKDTISPPDSRGEARERPLWVEYAIPPRPETR